MRFMLALQPPRHYHHDHPSHPAVACATSLTAPLSGTVWLPTSPNPMISNRSPNTSTRA